MLMKSVTSLQKGHTSKHVATNVRTHYCTCSFSLLGVAVESTHQRTEKNSCRIDRSNQVCKQVKEPTEEIFKT